MAETDIGLVELRSYCFPRASHGLVPLLSERTSCRQLGFEPLRSMATGGIPYVFETPRAACVSLLTAPETRELLEWQAPQTGLISQSEFRFVPSQHRAIAILSRPAIAWESLEIQRPSGEEFLFCIEPDLADVPGVAAIPFRIAAPQQADCSDLLAQVIALSANLFRPLGKSPTGGKDYSRTSSIRPEQPAFPFAQAPTCKTGASQNGYRKSYTEVRRPDGTTSRQVMSPWDLLLPLLQPPPFDLATQEQVFLPAELLPHQPEGVQFLASHEAALLGDGVQTGKTIQTIVAMKLLFQLGSIQSALVVCPIPLLMHWQKQLEKWAPELWQGLTVVRNNSPDRRRIMWRTPAHVYATNYETLVADFDEIVSIRGGQAFGLVVADEVQKIKNGKGGFEQLRQLGTQAKYRWGLSATPLENSVEDLVSIFDFLKPGLLRRNLENEQSAKKKIAPYFLRRRTRDVAQRFKEPRHDNHFVRMEGRQLEAYEQAFFQSVAELKAMGERVTLTAALAKLQALKQAL